MSASAVPLPSSPRKRWNIWNKACKQKTLMVCDEIHQDKHIIEACIWFSFNRKSVYMHVLPLQNIHATEQPYSKKTVWFPRSLIELLLPKGHKFSLFHAFFTYRGREMYSMHPQCRDLLWGKERRCGKTDTSCLLSLSPQHQHLATNPGWCHSVGHRESHDPHQSPTEVPQVSQNALLSGWLSPSLLQDGIYGMSEGHGQLLLKPGGFTGISGIISFKRYKAPMAD